MKNAMRLFVFAVSVAACGTVFAGPMDNAQQFQKKAVTSSLNPKSSRYGTVVTPARKAITINPSSYINIGAQPSPLNSRDIPDEKQKGK